MSAKVSARGMCVRPSAWLWVGVLGTVLVAALPARAEQEDRAQGSTPPNILFIVADDLATRLGCYGDAAAVTPRLDALAGKGVLFTHAYVQGSVCTPSRTSFMLGLHNAHAGANHFQKHPDTMTLGRWFRRHGYQTYSVGKIDHTEEFLDPEAWDIRDHDADVKPQPGLGPRLPLVEDLPQPDGRSLGRRFSLVGASKNPEQLPDNAVAEAAIRFVRGRRDRSKPFLAAVGFHSPHVPWDSTESLHEAVDAGKLKLERSPPDASLLPPGSLHYEPGLAIGDSLQRRAMRAYYAAVAHLDFQVGRLLDALDAEGLSGNTIVVFTSDHGYHLGWRGQWVKHSLSEQVLNVPVIVRGPGVTAGSRTTGIVELLDLFPTFCDLAGIAAPDHLDGRSFRPLLEDTQAPGKEAAFVSMPKGWGNGRSVRTARWRYIERQDGSVELYDHDADPNEYRNVADAPGHAAIIAAHAALLDRQFGPASVRQAAPAVKPRRSAAAEGNL